MELYNLKIKGEDFFSSPRITPFPDLLFFKDVHSTQFIDYENLSLITYSSSFIAESLIDSNDGREMYVLLDTINCDNFGHFFYESLVFLKSIYRLKNKFPRVRFLMKSDKAFKRKLTAFFDISCVGEIENKFNYFGVFPYVSSLNTNTKYPFYESLIESLYHKIHWDEFSLSDKDLNIVYFKRHVYKDNHTYDDDRFIIDDEIVDLVKSQPRSIVFESEDNVDFAKEVDLIKRCKILIVPDGSAFSVLGFYASNTLIITLGAKRSHAGTGRYDKCRLAYQFIQRNNKIYHLEKSDSRYTLQDILPILNGTISSL